MHFEELQNIRLLFVRLLEPNKSLVVFTESKIRVHKSARGQVACFVALFQFRDEAKSILSPPGVGIRADEHSDGGGAAVRNGDGSLENGMASSD
jgi:hypothetical protein